ncbi:hypothetical protein D3C87_1470380 [compost metagenome]
MVDIHVLAVDLRPMLLLKPFKAARGGGNAVSLFDQVGDQVLANIAAGSKNQYALRCH